MRSHPPAIRLVSFRFVLLSVCALVLGCPQPESSIPLEELRIKTLAIVYGQFVSKHQGTAPSSEAEFKKFIKTVDNQFWEGLKIDPAKTDELFVSPRDNQPYVIVYKLKNPSNLESDGFGPIVIWEKTGSGGTRYTGTSLGQIRILNEEEFKMKTPKL